jgi:hypothetical protein
MDYPLERTVSDTKSIRIKRIKAGSLFMLLATAISSILVPLIVFLGVLSLFGFQTVHVNYQPVVGVEGLLASLIMAPLFSFFLSIIAWVIIYFGILVWSLFGPITIAYVPSTERNA